MSSSDEDDRGGFVRGVDSASKWTDLCEADDSPSVMDKTRHRYPFCIVWSPIPLITWLIPFIGHLGICNSEGKIFDFAGPYTIGHDDFAFGAPTRYLTLDPTKIGKKGVSWDTAVAKSCEVYCKRMHNLCCDNCHSHVARALDTMGYAGFAQWNMIILCFWVFFCAPYVSPTAFIKSWLPSIIIGGVVFAFYFGLNSV